MIVDNFFIRWKKLDFRILQWNIFKLIGIDEYTSHHVFEMFE